ncbi:hypothetical protein IV203_034733 [Nitzschia inconspicua]|uniref:Uncharacterized protein n=1 Tax=Nitzschia inconspicua TaxID=303405 RepID=A0A9K3PTW1_9STRA|nr:hypothetical protein IV203_010586 [Nitzschia inconspicua]KAG7359635.1 hypothetical protein IV203_034733 [Nitzschia inconspicua]
MSSNSIARQNNNGSLPYGFIDEAVASLTSQGIEATRHTIYNHEKKLRRKSIPSEHPAPSTVRLQVRLANPNNTPAKVTSPSATTNKGGRPRGSTISAKFNLEKATNDGLEFDRTKKLTAGKIVAIGTHCLNKDVTQHQIEYIKIKEEEGQQRNDRKRKAQNDLRLKVAECKSIDESMWTAKHLKTMFTYKKHKEDPALAKTLTALKDQWNERRNRLSPTYTPEYYLSSTITDGLQPLPLPPPPAAAAIFDNGNDSAE